VITPCNTLIPEMPCRISQRLIRNFHLSSRAQVKLVDAKPHDV